MAERPVDVADRLRQIFGEQTKDAAEEMLISALEILESELDPGSIGRADEMAEKMLDKMEFSGAWGVSLLGLIGLSRHADRESWEVS